MRGQWGFHDRDDPQAVNMMIDVPCTAIENGLPELFENEEDMATTQQRIDDIEARLAEIEVSLNLVPKPRTPFQEFRADLWLKFKVHKAVILWTIGIVSGLFGGGLFEYHLNHKDCHQLTPLQIAPRYG
jgi:hypothetical protein